MDQYELYNPYNKESVRKARTAAITLIKEHGHLKGIMHISLANNHGSLVIDIFCLDDQCADEVGRVIPDYYFDFPIKITSPVWGTGELCTEYRGKIDSFGIILFSSEKVKERDTFFKMVIEKEKLKWNQMSSSERRKFVDSLVNKRGKDLCNCYVNWREEDF